MKRFILFLLVGALLVLPLSSCFADNKQNEGTTPNNTTENTTPEATTPEVTTPDNPPEVTTPPENNQNNPTTAAGEELDKSSDLIVALLASLEELYKDILWPSVSFSSKIDAIKDGAQALHVVFDVNDYYFVCAYNSPDNEKIRYEDCTWVKYDNETDIQEYYNGGKLVEAFQINKTLSVIDILSGDTSVPNVEHFQPHYPIFENGVNVATPIVVNETFICVNGFRYLNVANDKTIYHYWGNRFELATISCVCLDGEYYLPFYLATLEDGEIFDAQQALSTDQITYTLGDYYDAIINIMNTDKYNVEVNEKYTYRYGVVYIYDFVKYNFG